MKKGDGALQAGSPPLFTLAVLLAVKLLATPAMANMGAAMDERSIGQCARMARGTVLGSIRRDERRDDQR